MFDNDETILSHNASSSNNSINGSVSNNFNSSKNVVSPMTGLDVVTGLILEPTVELITFVIDSMMSLLTKVMTQSEFEYVMVDKDELKDLGEVGGTFTITDMGPYETASGKLKLKYPNFRYTPEEIFAGKLELLDVNFIKGSNGDSNWQNIRKIVSQWYQILRMVAIVGLLSVLIYAGIKIILSSTAGDKAKYKEMLLSWLIGVVLAFSMHYIMAFILNVTEEVLSLLKGLTGVIQVNAGGAGTFETNLLGLARFQMQQYLFTAKLGYLVMYTALVVYTFKFTFLYLKRVLKMAFLTVIAPIVALTYPIDKINDGKAQGFEMWLREFIYNALLQPMHYILYYILITTSLTLAAQNLIYAIACLMFLSQAEKLLKKVFGFNKAKGGTVDGVAGAFATGMITSKVMDYVKDPLHPLGSGNSKSSGSSEKSSSSNWDDELPFDTRDDANLYNFLGQNIAIGVPMYNNADEIKYIIPDIDDVLYKYRGNDQGLIAYLQSGAYAGINSGNIGDVMQMISLYRGDNSSPIVSVTNNSESLWENFKKAPVAKGLGSVGKSIVKPVWEVGKDAKYNGKRLRDKGLEIAGGAILGTAAAAVQAGISITDGKYNPLEAVATVGAGMVGVSKIAGEMKGAKKEYDKETLTIKKYTEEWSNKDEVVDFYNKEFHGKGKETKKRAAKNYVSRGVTDLKEQKQAIKFANQLKDERGMEEDEADKLAVATLQYKKSLLDKSILFDQKKRKSYLDLQANSYTGSASKESIIRLHDNFLDNVLDFDRANM